MTDEKEMRQVLANTLAEIANTDKRIVVLEADLMGCHATKAFKEAHPDRFVKRRYRRGKYDRYRRGYVRNG